MNFKAIPDRSLCIYLALNAQGSWSFSEQRWEVVLGSFRRGSCKHVALGLGAGVGHALPPVPRGLACTRTSPPAPPHGLFHVCFPCSTRLQTSALIPSLCSSFGFLLRQGGLGCFGDTSAAAERPQRSLPGMRPSSTCSPATPCALDKFLSKYNALFLSCPHGLSFWP